MDEVTRAAIKHAEALWKAGRRDDALSALRKINDPAAQRILEQLGGKSQGSNRLVLFGFGIVIAVVVVVVAAYLLNVAETSRRADQAVLDQFATRAASETLHADQLTSEALTQAAIAETNEAVQSTFESQTLTATALMPTHTPTFTLTPGNFSRTQTALFGTATAAAASRQAP